MYQNLEYLSWKRESSCKPFKPAQASRQSSASTDLALSFLPLNSNGFHDDSYQMQRDKDPSLSPRKLVSDSSLSTPSMRNQISAFLDHDAPFQSQSQSQYQYQPQFQSQSPFAPPGYLKGPSLRAATSTSLASTSTSTSTQPGASFGAYCQKYKEPVSRLTSTQQRILPRPSAQMPPHPPPGYSLPLLQQEMYPAYIPAPMIQPLYVPVLMPTVYTAPIYQQMPNYNGQYLTGRLKFFDDVQNYGFFVLDCDSTDLFVHYDDLLKSGITKDFIRMAIDSGIRFSFKCISYYGKYNLSYKAVDVQMLPRSP
jgi:hypothetical protein